LFKRCMNRRDVWIEELKAYRKWIWCEEEGNIDRRKIRWHVFVFTEMQSRPTKHSHNHNQKKKKDTYVVSQRLEECNRR
jgi:hypothetical protein